MIRSVGMKNFCQHLDLTVDLHPRMTAIIGANGSGKSNIFSAIIGAMTNEWVNAGKKEANISYGSKGSSFVSVNMIHNGVEAAIQRSIKGERSVLEFPVEGNSVTGEDQITEVILDMLGISKRMLMDYILVRQGTISGILSTTPAERAKSFQRLFGTERCEGIYAACLPVISKLSIPFDTAREIALIEAIESATKSIVHTEGEIACLQEQIPPESFILSLKESLIIIQRRKQFEESIQNSLRAIKASSDTLGSLRQDLATGLQLFEEAQATVDTLGPQADEAKVKIRLVKEFQKTWSIREQALKDLDKLKFQQEALECPVMPPGNRPDPEEEVRLRARLNMIAILTKAIDPDTGIGQCPLCLTDGIDLRKRLSDSAVEEAEIFDELQRLATRKEIFSDYDALNLAHERKCSVLATKIEERQRSIAEAPVLERPEEGEWELIVSTYSDAKLSQEQHSKFMASIREHIAATEHGRDVHTSQLTDAERKLEALPAIVQNEDKIKEEIVLIDKNLLAKASLEGSLEAMLDHLKQVKAQLAFLENDKKKAAKAEALASSLADVRNAFHRDGIPAQVSRSYLNALTNPTRRGSSINELLEIFEAPFYVEVSEEDLSFVAHFNDGRVQPAERLSGGEKVVLSLALRTAVNALFASHLSMLFLDEPTEYLDENNLNCLRTALEKLGQLAEDRGLQVVVITHEANLAPLFDKVIEL